MTSSIKTKPSEKTLSTPQRKSKAGRILAIVALQVVAVLFVELVLFVACMGEEEIFKFDPEIGFRHMSNKRITWRTEGFAQSYLNEDGMREPGLTVAKPANTLRVAVLGDSMVEGLQVPIESTFGEIIRKRLSPLNGQQVQFLNFGTSGYSTAQEYLQLKRQVLRYKPDLVIAFYDSRDIFENWAAPDQVITNVRPMAIHLPNSYLVVDSSPVRKWLRTPRARLLQATEWLRQNSRIVGLLTALDLELSQKDPWYRAFVESFSHPKRTIKAFQKAWATQQSSGPSFKIKFFEDAPDTSKKKVAPAPSVEQPASAPAGQAASLPAQPASLPDRRASLVGQSEATKPVFNSASSNETLATKPVFNSASSNEALSAKPESEPVKPAAVSSSTVPSVSPAAKPAVAVATAGDDMYRGLIKRTLASLYREMKADCTKSGAKFAVVSLPVRSQLCPLIGMETEFSGINYAQELEMVRKICEQEQVPFFDCAQKSEALPKEGREALFYTVHLTPQGQQFIADSVQPFVAEQLKRK